MPDSIRVELCGSLPEFQTATSGFLMLRPAEHGIIDDVLARGNTEVTDSSARFHLFVLRRGPGVVGCAVYALPRTMFLSVMHWSAATALAVDIFRRGLLVPTVIGPLAAVDSFASAWAAIAGRHFRERHELVLYEAKISLDPRPIPGRLRLAEHHDLDRTVHWREAFVTETNVSTNLAQVRRRVTEQLEARHLYVWDNDGIVSTIAHSSRRLGSARLYGVYTPMEQRGRGYATAMTAALTAHLLGTGHERCILFADAGNPASNRIYTKVGYRELGRWRELEDK